MTTHNAGIQTEHRGLIGGALDVVTIAGHGGRSGARGRRSSDDPKRRVRRAAASALSSPVSSAPPS